VIPTLTIPNLGAGVAVVFLGDHEKRTVTELLAIMLSKSLIVTAADELRDDLPSAGTVEITVGEGQWKCRFACDNEARTTRPALRAQAEEQAGKICAQIQKDADRRQGTLR